LLQANTPAMNEKIRVGIIMGGFSAERHVSVESGRNIYEKLAASEKYTPLPIFLTGSPTQHTLYILPIHILLKDSADDIHHKLSQATTATDNAHPIQTPAILSIIEKYAGKYIKTPQLITYQDLIHLVDFVFIALHGRPGEDGTLQAILEQHNLPYNGSSIHTSQTTIDKFTTNRFLHAHGIHVANQLIIHAKDWKINQAQILRQIETQFRYPFITKPVDDGCSVAVMKISNREMFQAYAELMFRKNLDLSPTLFQNLGVKPQTSFPIYERFLVEDLIEKGDAIHFLEITGGLLTHMHAQGQRVYEMFEPSEVIATQDILSLEEKFLAGEGQNITPARFDTDHKKNSTFIARVQSDLKKTAILLNIEGYARIDAMVKIYPQYVETWIMEINSLPAMTPATCIFHQCALRGYKPLDFIDAIIQYGFQAHNMTKQLKINRHGHPIF
jgi:D-alanine--D-alanine ligase